MGLFAPTYVLWHYTRGFEAFFHVWWNFIWFTTNFFGILNLATSLFSPWKRITERPDKKWNLEAYASALVVNMMSRLIGMILRLIIIIVGIFALVLLLTLGVAVLVAWVFAPILITGFFLYGMVTFITAII